MASVEIDGRRVAFDDRGTGPAVLLMHGLLMDRSMWDHAAETLADASRVVTVDFPGHGESDPVEIGYTFDDAAADMWKLCDALGIASAVLGGQSMGGFTELRMARQRPDRTRGLVLIDTSAADENPVMKPQYEAFLQVALADGVGEDLAGVLFLVLFSEAFGRMPDGEPWKKKLLGLDTPRVHGMVRAVLDRTPVTEHLGDINCPALVLHGEEDIAITMDLAEEMAEALGTTVTRVPGAGHASPVERPELVSPAIRAFLDGLP